MKPLLPFSLLLLTGLLLLVTNSIEAQVYQVKTSSGDVLDKSTSLQYTFLPVDEDGWTIITPSPDSKIIYVSNSEGDDSNDGLSPENPVATISQASIMARKGYPDHILLRCGDVWENPNVFRFKSGRSASEPMVISYYGDSITRPLLLINSFFLNINGDPISNVAFIGLEFYAWRHDPNSPDFESNEGVSVFRFVGAGGSNVLIEDCVARYTSLGAFDACCPDGTRFDNIKLRRNIVLHAWADSSYLVHTPESRIQGFYASETDSLLIEECFFDHNGWDEDVPGAGANMFNHNIYLQYNCSATTIIRNNIIARGAAHGVQLRGGGECSNNLFIRNAVNLNIGGVHSPLDGADAYSYARDNVFYEGRLMDSTNIAYPRTGANVAITILIPSTIENNIVAHSLNEAGTGIGGYNEEYGLGGSVTRINNIEYRWTDWQQIPDPDWFDPDRKIAHYQQIMGEEPSTIAFLEEASKRPLHTWWPEYSADTLIAFFKTGFSTDFTDDIPPQSPDTVFLINITDVSAEIEWPYAIDDQRTIAYNVYCENEQRNIIPVDEFTFKITGLTAETDYTAWIKSIDIGGNESEDSVVFEFTTLEADTAPPTTPVNLTFTQRTSESISLVWDPSMDNYGVGGYRIYQDGEIIPDLLASGHSVTIPGLTHSTEYTFKVTAMDNAGNESGYSNEITVSTVDIEKPSSPANVTLTATTGSTISLEWDPSTDNVGVVIYHVFVGGILVDSTALTNITLTGLEAGMKYSINIAALDAEGNKSRNSPPLVIQSLAVQEHIDDPGISIYPVPARDELKISGKDPIQLIEMYDVSGRKRMEQKTDQTRQIIINISTLPDGLYMVKILQEKGYILRKVIVGNYL